jgi:deazaflavin-dependent oxidoreductase (nitroreductase family)
MAVSTEAHKATGLKRLAELYYFAGEYLTMRLVPHDNPGSVWRRLFKIPRWLYQVGLGRAMSKHVLLLTTIGRKSGRARVTALGYTYDSSTDTYYLTAGWEGRTDWYRNVRANPQVHVRVGSREFDCVAEPVSEETAMRLLAEYAHRNPFASRIYARWTGVPFDGSDASLRLVAAHFPMIALHPRGEHC